MAVRKEQLVSFSPEMGVVAPLADEHLLDGGVFDCDARTPDIRQADTALYQPAVGQFRPDGYKHIRNGTVISGAYITARAMHTARVYLPPGYKPGDDNPIAIRTSALGTGINGFNHKTSKEILATNTVVISKGPPRYYGPTRALSLTEDANEMHGLATALEQDDIIGSTEEIYVAGESQSAMKGLGFIALAPFYGREVPDAHLSAPCFINQANWRNTYKFTRYGTSMLGSIARAGLDITKEVIRERSLEAILELQGTIDPRDMHHHMAVVPVLLSGETGTFLPLISTDQAASVDLYGKDRSSRAHRTYDRLKAGFTNMDISLSEKYGHVDGINSPETKARRHLVFVHATQRADVRPGTTTLTSL